MRLLQMFAVLAVIASGLMIGSAAEAVVKIDHCPVTVTHSVKVTKDLTCNGTNGIVVGKGHITIDLNGHTLTGDHTGGTAGVDDSGGFDRVTVKNGTLRGFDYGVNFVAAKKAVVKHVTAVDDYDGIEANGFPSSITLKSVNASANRGTGIDISQGPVSIRSTKASNNAFDGMYLIANHVRVHGGRADGNGEYGIEFSGLNQQVEGTEVGGNGVGNPALGSGIIFEYAGGIVDGVTASGNALDGISLGRQPAQTGPTGTIKNSKAYANVRRGIFVDGEHGTVKDSTALANRHAGIYTSGESERIDGNHADANGYDGGSDGTGLGIETINHPTTTPTGHNEASGNDAPAQCNPTSLC